MAFVYPGYTVCIWGQQLKLQSLVCAEHLDYDPG
jgi:hypothetical protein